MPQTVNTPPMMAHVVVMKWYHCLGSSSTTTYNNTCCISTGSIYRLATLTSLWHESFCSNSGTDYSNGRSDVGTVTCSPDSCHGSMYRWKARHARSFAE
jgi:hypothetical protein